MRCLMLCLVGLPLAACDTGPAEPSRGTTDPYDRSTSLRISGTVVWPDCTPALEARVHFYATESFCFLWDACPSVAYEVTTTQANGSFTIEATLYDCTRLDLVLWSTLGYTLRSPNVVGTCEADQSYDFVLRELDRSSFVPGELEQCVPAG